MNRTVIMRLVPLTTSVAIHAAFVALVISLVDLTAPIERVFLLELTELETPRPAASFAPVLRDTPRPPEPITRPKAMTKPKPVAPVEPASSLLPPRPVEPAAPKAPPLEPPAPRAPALEPPAPEARALESPAPETRVLQSMAPEPQNASSVAASAPATSAARNFGASHVGPFDVTADAAPRSAASARAQSDTTSPPGAAVASLPPGSITRRAIPRGGYQVRPAYPTSARRLGIEGTTLLGVLVANDGRVTEIVVKQSAGHPDLDRAAADAVRQWRFEPARQGSDAVSMWVLLPVEFRLR
jgi:periplasmic protein TonB